MTEPQELRSIDELFRNTFNNLPETPADSGWDTPSERVWQHVRENIPAPRTGWSLQSLMLLAGFAVTLAVGLYFAFTPKASAPETTVAPIAVPSVAPATTTAPVVTVPESASPATTVAAPEKAEKVIVTPVLRHISAPEAKTPVVAPLDQPATVLPAVVPEQQPAIVPPPVPEQREPIRSSGAAPLPGSKQVALPNTTEQLKAEHARAMELRWKTPLPVLPLPINKKATD